MPETRKILKYTYPEGLSPEEKIPANAIIEESTYEVSDEQLAEELADKKMAELRELLKQGAEVVITKPPEGKLKARNLYVNPANGEINHEEVVA